MHIWNACNETQCNTCMVMVFIKKQVKYLFVRHVSACGDHVSCMCVKTSCEQFETPMHEWLTFL